MLSVVQNYYLLALLIIHSLRTSMCLQIFIHAFRHFPWPGLWGRWPWLFCQPHLVQGHNPHPWNFIYNAQKLLYLSGWSWFQFSIPVWRYHSRGLRGGGMHKLDHYSLKKKITRIVSTHTKIKFYIILI